MPRPECRCGVPKPSRTALITRAISRSRDFGKARTRLRKRVERSIRNVGFQIPAVAFHRPRFVLARDFSIHPFCEPNELFLRNSVLLKSIVVGVNSDWPKRNDLIAVQNSDVFAVGGA